MKKMMLLAAILSIAFIAVLVFGKPEGLFTEPTTMNSRARPKKGK